LVSSLARHRAEDAISFLLFRQLPIMKSELDFPALVTQKANKIIPALPSPTYSINIGCDDIAF